VLHLIVMTRTGYWGLLLRQPRLSVEAPNTVTVRPLADLSEAAGAAQAMAARSAANRSSRVRGAKIALIDSYVFDQPQACEWSIVNGSIRDRRPH